MNPDHVAAAADDVAPAGPLVVALGGGADSAVAAWSVAHREQVRGIFICHHLEGSAVLETAARAVTSMLDMELETVDAPVAPGPSLEERARNIRWRAIEDAVGVDETIVTGHTGDDQAETVLMNLLRGSGTAGLAGMARSRPGVVRPLLSFDRAGIRSVALALSLPFADDPANRDPSHLRNRIRSELLPLIERDYRPGIRSVLARTGTLAAADERIIEGLASRIPVLIDDGVVLIPTAPLQTAPVPVAARAVRTALRRLLAPYAGTAADVSAVLGVATGKTPPVTITSDLLVKREGPFVAIGSGESTPLDETRIRVPASVPFGPAVVRLAFDDGNPVHRHSTLLLDAAAVGPDAVVRGTREGDRIEIDGGSKAVRTVLAERGIPVRKRTVWPVIASGGRIAAIVGVRVAPWARPSSGRTVVVSYERGQL